MLRCGSQFGYGSEGCPPDISGDVVLLFEIELTDCQKKIEGLESLKGVSTILKEKGNELFNNNMFQEAFDVYETALDYFRFFFP